MFEKVTFGNNIRDEGSTYIVENKREVLFKQLIWMIIIIYKEKICICKKTKIIKR